MSTWRFTLPMVLLASLAFACETPVPDDQIQSKVSTASNRSGDEKKATTPKKSKPAPTTGTATTNTTPTTGDATPTLPTTPATTDPPPATTDSPPVTDPPPAADPPPVADPPAPAQQNIVEIDCCVGTQFVACFAASGTQCADVNVSTDCDADPTFDDLCQ